MCIRDRFKEELQSGEGDITVWINSPGGDVFAAAQIYNCLLYTSNRIYTDVLVQTAADYNESRACATMIDRSKLENVILVADRGYENYNIFAHAIEKGWKFADVYKRQVSLTLSLIILHFYAQRTKP